MRCILFRYTTFSSVENTIFVNLHKGRYFQMKKLKSTHKERIFKMWWNKKADNRRFKRTGSACESGWGGCFIKPSWGHFRPRSQDGPSQQVEKEIWLQSPIPTFRVATCVKMFLMTFLKLSCWKRQEKGISTYCEWRRRL